MSDKHIHINKLKQVSHCGNKMLYIAYSEYKKPFSIDKTDGEHSLESCVNCAKVHKGIEETQTDLLGKFPACCDAHKKLIELPQYDRSHFETAPKEVADKIMFTHHHIINYIDKENWKDDIFDYLDYVIESFGSFPSEYGSPYQIHNFFDVLKELSYSYKDFKEKTISKTEYKNRLDQIFDKIKWFNTPYEEQEKSRNILMKSYEKWFNTFPFDLPYFSHLKERFSLIFPIYKRHGRKNKYSGKEVKEEYTPETLADALIQTTSNILTSINALKLYEEGKLSEVEKLNIELIKKNRQVELKELEELPNGNKQEYIKVIKNWLKGEKEFVKEIMPYINKLPSKTSTSHLSRPNRTDLAYFVYYTDLSKELQTENPFPSDKAWKEIGERFEKNPKNIQTIYNQIVNNQEERLKKSRKKTIEYLVENMLNDYPNAKKNAEIELKQAILNS